MSITRFFGDILCTAFAMVLVGIGISFLRQARIFCGCRPPTRWTSLRLSVLESQAGASDREPDEVPLRHRPAARRDAKAAFERLQHHAHSRQWNHEHDSAHRACCARLAGSEVANGATDNRPRAAETDEALTGQEGSCRATDDGHAELCGVRCNWRPECRLAALRVFARSRHQADPHKPAS